MPANDPSYIELVSAYLFFGGCFLGFIWIGGLCYLKRKWLPLLEEVLDEGVRFYSLNIFLSGLGVLQYNTVFLSTFHANRYGMLDKRDKVPRRVQSIFIFAFLWFMFCIALMIASMLIHEVYDL